MDYNQSYAATGNYRGRHHQRSARSEERAPVNIFKSAGSYEILVFAPGRIKEHFKLDLRGSELTISYTPPEGFQRPEWIRREYSRGGFIRTFSLDSSVDASKIVAKYVNGVLEVTIPFISGAEAEPHQIPVN
jgi:HSP20 family protein